MRPWSCAPPVEEEITHGEEKTAAGFEAYVLQMRAAELGVTDTTQFRDPGFKLVIRG